MFTSLNKVAACGMLVSNLVPLSIPPALPWRVLPCPNIVAHRFSLGASTITGTRWTFPSGATYWHGQGHTTRVRLRLYIMPDQTEVADVDAQKLRQLTRVYDPPPASDISRRLLRLGLLQSVLNSALPHVSTRAVTDHIYRLTGVRFNLDVVTKWRRANEVPAQHGGSRKPVGRKKVASK